MSKKQLRVEDLRIGMYVVELDRPWLGTPFAFQGFPITSEDQIHVIAQYAKTVFVDPERETFSGDARAEASESSRHVIYSALDEKEVAAAKEVYRACEDAIEQSLDKVRSGGDIEVDKLIGAVSRMTDLIRHNPDVMLLLNAIRQTGSYEMGRAVDTSILMISFGRFLQYPKHRLETLGLAGLLLDVGKAKLPEVLLHKSEPVTNEELEILRTHVLHSTTLVQNARGLPHVVEEIVAQHQERQDGTGYPKGLFGSEISLDGAIAGMVDSFSAVTSLRPYAGQLSPSGALGVLHKLRGTAFHESLVDQFIQWSGIYPVGSAVELNTGEVGLVIAQNPVRRLQPRVMVILDANRNVMHPQRILNLLNEPKSATDEIYRIRRTVPKSTLPINLSDYFL